MQEPPVAQKNDKIPPALHLLLSLSSRKITWAGELLLFIFFYFASSSSPPLLPTLLFPSYSFPYTLPHLPLLHLLLSLLFSLPLHHLLSLLLCLNLGNIARSLARPPFLHSLSLNAHSVFSGRLGQPIRAHGWAFVPTSSLLGAVNHRGFTELQPQQ